ncbi:hypothetical protein ACFLWC_06560 [Chloroflexota bacterium]
MLRPKSSQLSFYGSHVYDRAITKDHFLKLLFEGDRRGLGIMAAIMI